MEEKRKEEKLAIIINTRNISINILISNSILSHDTWSTHDKILCPRGHYYNYVSILPKAQVDIINY